MGGTTLTHRLVRFLLSWAHTRKRRPALRALGWAASVASVGHLLDPDEQERIAMLLDIPGRVDRPIIEHVDAVLSHCERLDDVLGPRAVLDTVLAQRDLARSLVPRCPEKGVVLPLCVGDQPVGAGVPGSRPATGEITRLFVRPGYRGRGYGRRILTALEEHARAVGATGLLLETGVRNTAAVALFGSAGYRPVPGYVPGRDRRVNRAFGKSLVVPQRR